MLKIQQLFRLLYINHVLYKHGLDEIILAAHLLRPYRFLLYLLPWNWFRHNREPRAVRLRKVLEDLGPIFVKFGQILSTRQDLLPEDIAQEFKKLQDNVPPFSGDLARSIIEKSLRADIHELFDTFDAEPFASASIAQVHAATLPGNQEVIVKVLRPGIQKTIRRDVSILYTIAGLAERYWSEGKRLRPTEVVAEFEHTIMDELDLQKEAANASQLKRNFENNSLLYVPGIHWSLSRRDVMVMERIHGIPVNEVDTLRKAGIDLKTLAEHGVEIFFTQVFRHNFFHADMHPGNIFVSPAGQYIAVDFGIMGTLSPDDQRYLAENFLAFFNRDYHRVAELHVESGWVPRETRVDEFESAIRAVCEPIFERPLKDISFGQLLLRLFQTAGRFNMPIQPQLVLLQKTLLNIEGLGRQLYPDLDLWKTAKPFLERWMSEYVGWRGLARSLKANLPKWAETLPEIPALLHEVLNKANDGKLSMQWENPQIEQQLKELQNSHRHIAGSTMASGLIIAASITLVFESQWSTTIFGMPLISTALALLSGFIYLKKR
jgi:ubiquinone biosynthesis protein